MDGKSMLIGALAIGVAAVGYMYWDSQQNTVAKLPGVEIREELRADLAPRCTQRPRSHEQGSQRREGRTLGRCRALSSGAARDYDFPRRRCGDKQREMQMTPKPAEATEAS